MISDTQTEHATKTDGDLQDTDVLQDDLKALERVRELELELAQTKLAHVEAECRNQVCECMLFGIL